MRANLNRLRTRKYLFISFCYIRSTESSLHFIGFKVYVVADLKYAAKSTTHFIFSIYKGGRELKKNKVFALTALQNPYYDMTD